MGGTDCSLGVWGCPGVEGWGWLSVQAWPGPGVVSWRRGHGRLYAIVTASCHHRAGPALGLRPVHADLTGLSLALWASMGVHDVRGLERVTVANAVLLAWAPVRQRVLEFTGQLCPLLSVWPWAGQALRLKCCGVPGVMVLGGTQGVSSVSRGRTLGWHQPGHWTLTLFLL